MLPKTSNANLLPTPSIAITKASNDMSKLILGVGFNSKGKYKTKIGGAYTSAYSTWRNMLRRAYCQNTRKKQPTYINCSVAERWHDFQGFAEWFENHKYSNCGYQLDKDLLILGNKIYAPDRCVFVPRQLNNLLNGCAAARGQYPQGVCFDKRRNKFQTYINIDGKREHLGYFDCPQEAYNAYKIAKEAYVKEKALEWQDRIADNVFDALMNWELDC